MLALFCYVVSSSGAYSSTTRNSNNNYTKPCSNCSLVNTESPDAATLGKHGFCITSIVSIIIIYILTGCFIAIQFIIHVGIIVL